MRLSGANVLLALGATAALCACSRDTGPAPLLGTLEWDRIGVPAEVSEPITRILVNEGDSVQAGQLLLTLDPRRTQAQLDAAQADVARLTAALDKLRNGARSETIDATRAVLARAQTTAANARIARTRAADIRKRGLNSQADLDNANTALRQAEADVKSAQANLAELLNGTRPEDLAQGEAALAQAKAQAAQLAITLERLSVHAPRAVRPWARAWSACWLAMRRMRKSSCRNRNARRCKPARIFPSTSMAWRKHSPPRSSASAARRVSRRTMRCRATTPAA